MAISGAVCWGLVCWDRGKAWALFHWLRVQDCSVDQRPLSQSVNSAQQKCLLWGLVNGRFSRTILSFHPSALLLTRPKRLGSPRILAQRLLSRSLGWYSLARLAVPPLPPHFQGGQAEEAGPAWDREKKGGLRRGTDLPAGPWHNSAGLLCPEPKLLFAREKLGRGKVCQELGTSD